MKPTISVVTVGGERPFTCASHPGREYITAARTAEVLGIVLDRPPIHVASFYYDRHNEPVRVEARHIDAGRS